MTDKRGDIPHMESIPEGWPWRPIESAPKDGTIVLTYDPIGVTPGFCSAFNEWPADLVVRSLPARWCAYKHREGGEWQTIIAEYDFGVPSDPSFDATAVVIKPTHWCPLPPPPEVK